MNHQVVKSISTCVDRLAFRRVTFYLWLVRSEGLFTIRRLVLVVSVITVLVTALAVSIFLRFHRAVLNESFCERSAMYASAFADSMNAWLAMEDEEMIKTAARFLLLGSALYVQVISGDLVLVDERMQVADQLDLRILSEFPVERTLRSDRLDPGPRYLDVIIPIGLLPEQEALLESGYVRIGLDATSVSVHVRSMALIVSGVGAAFALFVIAAFLLALKKLRPRQIRSRGEGTDSSAISRPSLIRLGSLQINEADKQVTLYNRSVPLTPKQYAVLHLLASDVGRVFSEAEILSAVWPESNYANSKDVKQYVYLLRRRLEQIDPGASKFVVNVPGFGYKLVPPAVDDNLT